MKPLEIGDRIEIYGGYDYDPLFLKKPRANKRNGKVIDFIEGQNTAKAAVVRLENVIFGNNLSGDIVVLELRYLGQTWASQGPVHVELCDFIPENKA